MFASQGWMCHQVLAQLLHSRFVAGLILGFDAGNVLHGFQCPFVSPVQQIITPARVLQSLPGIFQPFAEPPQMLLQIPGQILQPASAQRTTGRAATFLQQVSSLVQVPH
uniref:Secreted protein n=1 Tax=Cacopsylla melanoneura TaxID=428564 RepID=A0A8D8Y181_9HEMI